MSGAKRFNAAQPTLYIRGVTFMTELPINQVVCGNCLKVMKEVPDGCVDLVFTDPPYMISSEVVITRERNPMKFAKFRGKDVVQDFGEWDKFENKDEFFKFTFAWVDEAARVLRGGGMFCTFFDRDKINFVSRHLQEKLGFKHKDYFAWIKSNPVPQARKVKWMSGWEIVGMWQKPEGKLIYNYQLGQHPDYIKTPICMGNERLDHPTQKPEAVVKPFIEYWSNPGDIVLDPFAGVGTTAAVCKRLNRRWICIEINKKYCEMARRRLDKVERPLEVFA